MTHGKNKISPDSPLKSDNINSQESFVQNNIIQLANGDLMEGVTDPSHLRQIYHNMLRDCVKYYDAEATLYVYHHLCQRLQPTRDTYQIIEPLHYHPHQSCFTVPIEWDQVKTSAIHHPTNSTDTYQQYVSSAQKFIVNNPELLATGQPQQVSVALAQRFKLAKPICERLTQLLKKKGYLTTKPSHQSRITKYFNYHPD